MCVGKIQGNCCSLATWRAGWCASQANMAWLSSAPGRNLRVVKRWWWCFCRNQRKFFECHCDGCRGWVLLVVFKLLLGCKVYTLQQATGQGQCNALKYIGRITSGDASRGSKPPAWSDTTSTTLKIIFWSSVTWFARRWWCEDLCRHLPPLRFPQSLLWHNHHLWLMFRKRRDSQRGHRFDFQMPWEAFKGLCQQAQLVERWLPPSMSCSSPRKPPLVAPPLPRTWIISQKRRQALCPRTSIILRPHLTSTTIHFLTSPHFYISKPSSHKHFQCGIWLALYTSYAISCKAHFSHKRRWGIFSRWCTF